VTVLTTQSVFPSDEARKLYQLDLDLHWRAEIVEANANFKVAVAVREAPLEFLLGMDSSRWLLTRLGENALRVATLGVINALTDRTKGSLTLEFVRQRALELCEPTQRAPLEHYLASEFAARSFPDLERRALRIRHKFLAHTDAEHLRHLGRFADARVNREEVGDLLEAAKELVSVLSFEVGRSFDFHPGDEDYGMKELITDVVAKNSHVLVMPEQGHQHVFRHLWDRWAEQERNTFNDWRIRTGRPPFGGR